MELKEYRDTILVYTAEKRVANAYAETYWFNINDIIMKVKSLVRHDDGSYTVVGREIVLCGKDTVWYTQLYKEAFKYRKSDFWPKPFVKKAWRKKNRRIVRSWAIKRYAVEKHMPYMKLELPAGTVVGYHGADTKEGEESLITAVLGNWVREELEKHEITDLRQYTIECSGNILKIIHKEDKEQVFYIQRADMTEKCKSNENE